MGGFKTFAEVRLDPVVIEERIVDVEQKDGIKRCAHFDVSLGEWGVANHPSPQQSARRAR
jgi:hypothetical protein